MHGKVFLAGATGAIGARLMPLLLDAGYEVFGATRSEAKATALQAAGAGPIVVDVFDGPALSQAMAAIRPEIVIHQLTDLPAGLDPSRMTEGMARTTRIRTEGTRNLVAAALGAGTRRLIAQSLACWVYAPGSQPYSENDPLDLRAEATDPIVVEGVVTLERLTTTSPPLEGVVLRYAKFTGREPGTTRRPARRPCTSTRQLTPPCLRFDRAQPGIFNIAEGTGFVSPAKARGQLVWDPGFRLGDRRASTRKG